MAGIILLSLLGWGALYALLVDDDDAGSGDTSDSPDDKPTDGPDFLEGDNGDDRIFGNGGDDLIVGNGGDDALYGGADTDVVFGGAGEDFLRGGSGDDLVVAGADEDILYGDGGDDLMVSADIIDEEAYLNSIPGATSEDDIVINFDFDADPGEADQVFAGAGDDLVLFGNFDEVSGGSGADVLTMGDWMEPGKEAIITDFDKDEDVLVYSYASGTAEPTVTFGETDDGAAEVRINGDLAVVLKGVDFSTLNTTDVLLEEREA